MDEDRSEVSPIFCVQLLVSLCERWGFHAECALKHQFRDTSFSGCKMERVP